MKGTSIRSLACTGRGQPDTSSSKWRGYDRYVRGRDTLSGQEQRGLDLFRSRCASCHTEPLFTNNQFASNGLPVDTALNDLGRSKVTRIDADAFTFRVPSLRNIAVTHPYMHDGRYKRLREVLAFYGSPEQHANYADPRIRAIGVLRDDERKDMIAFLFTLTDHEFLNDPRHRDPFTVIQR